MSDDDFDGIFDDLNPDDFHSDTTAFQELSRPKVDFATWVENNLRAVEIAYATSEGEMCPISALVNDSVSRLFIPDDEETVGNYLDRMNDEAKKMNATWFFLARPTKVASHLVEEVHDATTSPLVQEAKDAGALEDGLFWYAEKREETKAKRMGIYFDNGNGILERPTESSSEEQASELLEAVLNR